MSVMSSANDADLTALRDRCTKFLHGHGPVRAADLLATIPADTAVDRYGDGAWWQRSKPR